MNLSAFIDLLDQAKPYFVDPIHVEAPPPEGEVEGNQDVVEVHRLRFERVDNEGLSSQVVQRLFLINSPIGAQFFGIDDIWYDASRSQFFLQRAVVYRHGRAQSFGSDAGDAIPHTTGNRARRVRFPRLQSGDRVELVYVLAPVHQRVWTALGGRYLGDLFAFRGPYPVHRVDYVLYSAHRLAVSQVKLDEPEFRVHNGLYMWHWTSGPLPPFFADPNGPSITDRSPFVQTSDFGSWSGLADWYSKWLDERGHMSATFRDRLLSLVPRRRDVPDTVTAVWAYISGHLRYLGQEEGLHAYIPSPIESVFSAQQGDCKDGALLLSSWLRAEGIDAYLALVRTRHMGQVAEGAATLAAFDHAVVYVPAIQQWIDTTAPSFHVHELPSSDQGGLALVIRRGQNELLHIPEATAEENLTRRVVRLFPVGDGTMMAQGSIVVRGADAPDLRTRYASPASRKRVFGQWLDRNFPGGHVEQVSVRGLEEGSDELEIDFRARVPQRTALPSAAWTARHYAPLMASELSRNDDKNLDLRWTTDESWSMPASERECDLRSRDLPLDRISPFGEIHVNARCDNGWLTVQTTVTQSATDIAEKDYEQFRNFWLAADHDLNQPVLEVTLAVSRTPAKPTTPSSIALRAPFVATDGH